MGRPIAVAVGVSALLHLAWVLWAWTLPLAREAASSAPPGSSVPALRVELRQPRPAPAGVEQTRDEAVVRAPSSPALPQRRIRRTAAPVGTDAAPQSVDTPDGPAPRQEGDVMPAQAGPAGSAPAAGKSMDDILKSVPAATRAVARSLAPNAALAASAARGTRPFAPLEQALSREQAGEQKLPFGVTRVVTKDGTAFCLRELRSGNGTTTLVSTCP